MNEPRSGIHPLQQNFRVSHLGKVVQERRLGERTSAKLCIADDSCASPSRVSRTERLTFKVESSALVRRAWRARIPSDSTCAVQSSWVRESCRGRPAQRQSRGMYEARV